MIYIMYIGFRVGILNTWNSSNVSTFVKNIINYFICLLFARFQKWIFFYTLIFYVYGNRYTFDDFSRISIFTLLEYEGQFFFFGALAANRFFI